MKSLRKTMLLNFFRSLLVSLGATCVLYPMNILLLRDDEITQPPSKPPGTVTVADDVGPDKMYGESCPCLYARSSTGRSTATSSCVSVGIPSGKERAFVAATTTSDTPKTKGKPHARRKGGVERSTYPNTSFGGILGSNGAYFLERGTVERVCYRLKTMCFPQPRLTLWAKSPPQTLTNPTRRTQVTFLCKC